MLMRSMRSKNMHKPKIFRVWSVTLPTIIVCLFVTEEILYSSMAVSDHGSYAKPLCYWCSWLQGRHYHLNCVNRLSDCIGYRIEIVCLIGTLSTILQHFTHNEIQWPTAARRWQFALRDVSCRQSCHLSTPSHPRVPPGWPYCRQAQCGRWFTV